MKKAFRPLITRGIRGLIDEDKNTSKALTSMFRIASEVYDQSYFIAFNKEWKR
ncbi:hypothetical protein [Sporosarcina sp. G11-34]|uniref:hypothetical protein n=1 Tax=Sporosarcina sp. G11-34 TaxID=2849605 RepID=UPI0022A98A65|nr:hypothetical protein [Sporosarcina sp. G11-34]MCZ2260608.1 hypothetical protein [Sporosarcina sp. G11-34]